MALQIGRKGFIGLAKETTPGVPVTPSVYLPFVEQSLVEKHEPIGDVAAKGIREQQYASVEGKKWGEGSFTVNVDEAKIGHLLYMLLGSVSTGTVSGSIKDHTFSRNNSNTPQTYSLTLDRQTDKKLFPYATAKSGELNFADDLATLKADILSQFPVTTTSGTLTVTSGHMFAWKDASVRFAATIGAADVATPTQISEFSLTIDNDTAPSWRSGVQQPASIDHQSFRVYGTFKLFFENTTQLDNYRALTKQAMLVKFTGRGIGASFNESITINLPLIRLQEAVVETPIDNFLMVTCTFEAEYDPTTAKMIDIVLRNTTASY